MVTQNPDLIKPGETGTYTIPAGTEFKVGKKAYTLKAGLPVSWNNWSGNSAGLYTSSRYSPNSILAQNHGCYASPEEIAGDALNFANRLASKHASLRLELRVADTEERTLTTEDERPDTKHLLSLVRREKEILTQERSDIEALFTITRAA